MRAVQSVTTEREAIAFEIAEIVAGVTDMWDVAIERILIFSAQTSASLSSAAQQKQLRASTVIAARAEVNSARLMRQVADILGPWRVRRRCRLGSLRLCKRDGRLGQQKVIFAPMQLQSDVVGQLASGSGGGLERRR